MKWRWSNPVGERVARRAGGAISILMLFAAPLILGCDDALLSKEQRQVSDAIKQAIGQDPARINAPFQDGEPPLHLALIHHLPGLFDWLLDRGADPNARDSSGETALHHAVYFDLRDQTAIRALIKRGAEVNAKDNHGGTPLCLAAGSSYPTTVKWLLDFGADPMARNQLGETPLHAAATPQPLASAENVERVIHLLVAGGADVEAPSENQSTPLEKAALIGSVIATRALLREGAKVDQPGLGGGTALHVAVVFGRPRIAEILLQAGADPNRRDDNGLTPLARARRYPAVTSQGQTAAPVDTREVVDLLKKFGAIDPAEPIPPGSAPSE